MLLDFYKDNRYGMGGDVQGQWTINTTVSSDVGRVEFYLDGQLQKNAASTPFSLGFNTANFAEAQHTLKVIAYDSAGATAVAEKQSKFVGFPVNFVVVIIGFIVAVTVVTLVICVFRIRKYYSKKTQN